MILIRAPFRISFVGGGTDLPDFYRQYPGRVVSVTIDKFVFLVLNRTPLINKISARYSIAETVNHPSELQHTRIKAALVDLGIHNNLEIGSFASIPAKTGLGSSSSFSVALIKGLYSYLGKKISGKELAEAACRLEINLVGEPIGKQDQYAAAFGGFNIFQFNGDESVDVKPILLDYKKRLGLENRILVFFTGITRSASSVLTSQKQNIGNKLETLKEMSDSAPEFSEKLLKGDYEGMGAMLHQGWLRKKSLTSNISNFLIYDLYSAGIKNGAWGGKILGAGGGGCVMFLTPVENKTAIREAVKKVAQHYQLNDFCEIPVRFTQSSCDILHKSEYFFS